MNGITDRRIIAQCILILALCLGGWFMLIEPRASELSELQRLIQEHDRDLAPANQEAVEAVAHEVSTIRNRLDAIEALNTLGDDSSRLYDQFTELARRYNVTVISLSPREQSNVDEIVTQRAVELTLEAEFEHLIAFLNALYSLPGFVRTESVSFSPHRDDSRQLVTGRIRCHVLSFDTSNIVLALKGQNHVQP